MKNIYGYIYWNIGIYVIPCAVVAVAAGIYFHLPILYLLAAAGVVLMFARGLSGIQFLKRKGIDVLDLRRDFVYARKCGPIVVGDKYLYVWEHLVLRIHPVEDIVRVGGIDQTVTTVYSRNTVKRRYMYATVKTSKKKQYRLRISSKNLQTLIWEARRRRIGDFG